TIVNLTRRHAQPPSYLIPYTTLFRSPFHRKQGAVRNGDNNRGRRAKNLRLSAAAKERWRKRKLEGGRNGDGGAVRSDDGNEPPAPGETVGAGAEVRGGGTEWGSDAGGAAGDGDANQRSDGGARRGRPGGGVGGSAQTGRAARVEREAEGAPEAS